MSFKTVLAAALGWERALLVSAALAVGSMISSGEDLIDALFGGGGAASRLEVAFGLIAAALGFKEKPYFQATPGAEKPPAVKFDFNAQPAPATISSGPANWRARWCANGA